jgi:ATP adenylyltransferase
MTRYITAPWRAAYVRTASSRRGCIFCRALKSEDDAGNGVLFRGRFNFVMLNRYPYNPGHLMVAPNRHLADLAGLRPEEAGEFMELIQTSLKVLGRAYRPQGFNIGLNIGRNAGAGVVGHVHAHIVPRWAGDANFMPLFSRTRVFIEGLEETCARLRPRFEKAAEGRGLRRAGRASGRKNSR